MMHEHGGDRRRWSVASVVACLEHLGIEHRLAGRTTTERLEFRSLRAPGPHGLYFLAGGVEAPEAAHGSLFIATSPVDLPDSATLVVAHPQVTYYRLMRELAVDPGPGPQGVHPSAIVDAAADVHPDAWIGPFCVVGAAKVGPGVRLRSHVVVFDGATIEDRAVIEPHTVIGATGVAWAWDPASGERVVQPQTGTVRVGEDCFVGTNVTIVRGSVNEVTELGRGSVVAHGTKIGHGCRVGELCHFANSVTLAGNVDVGAECFFGAGSVVRSEVTLADRTIVGAGAVVTKDVLEPGRVLVGVPAVARLPRQGRLAGVPRRKDELREDV